MRVVVAYVWICSTLVRKREKKKSCFFPIVAPTCVCVYSATTTRRDRDVSISYVCVRVQARVCVCSRFQEVSCQEVVSCTAKVFAGNGCIRTRASSKTLLILRRRVH